MTTPDSLIAAFADRYRVERELGAGGMATVYLAQDLKHDRKVALNVLRPELLWADSSEVAVPTGAVVEAVDVRRHIRDCELAAHDGLVKSTLKCNAEVHGTWISSEV